MGVKLGRVLAKNILTQLNGPEDVKGHDSFVRLFFFSQVDTVELLTVHNVPMHNSHSAWNLGSAQVGQQRIMQIHAY